MLKMELRNPEPMIEVNRRAFLQATALSPLAALGHRRVLVACATRCGSTGEIAQTILRDLKSRGFAGDVIEAGKVTTLAGYDAVVAGSAVRFGKWLPEAVEFVRRHQAELNRMPTAFFSVHMQNTGADDASKKARLAYIDPVRALVKPGTEVFFAGKMDTSRLGLLERTMSKVMKAREADQRDWNAIHVTGSPTNLRRRHRRGEGVGHAIVGHVPVRRDQAARTIQARHHIALE